MKSSVALTTGLVLGLTFVEGFSSPGPCSVMSEAKLSTKRSQSPAIISSANQRTTTTSLFQGSSVNGAAETTSSSNFRNLPSFVYKLNASTKWLVTLANTLGIWTRLPHYEGPFIVVGAIAATYGTEALKQWINHDRPEGAPFSDPGMPSSHSLVSFFMAAAWGSLVCRGVGVPLAWAGASLVALLRVICGYHSWDQIGVGALLGGSMGFLWAKLGRVAYQTHSQVTLQASWGFYVAGSTLFIATKMRDWLHKDKHL